MRVPRTLIIVVLSTCVLLPTFGKSAVAQRPRGPKMKELRAAGTIKGMRGRLLHVEVEGKQEWLISLPEKHENVVFEATATSKWLRPRMPVRFTATVIKEKRMREIVIREPVTELTVAPVRPDVGMGVFPEQNTDQRDSLFTRRAGQAKKKRAGNEPQKVECLIIGRLIENKDGKLRVAAGNIPVRLELAERAEISVQWNDLQWVRMGDKVQITARHPPGRLGQAQGQALSITAAKVLDVELKSPRGQRKSARDGKSDESKKDKSS